MEGENEITIERPTGPRLTMADPASKGEVVAYNAGRSVSRAARATVATRRRQVAVYLCVYFVVWLALLYATADIRSRYTFEAAYQATTTAVGPWSTDANGWTVLEPTTTTSGSCGGSSATANGTCIYYVDAVSGVNDATNCKGYLPPVTSSPATACASIHYAFTQTRFAKPDWVLMKRGQTHSTDPSLTFSGQLGQDVTHPAVLSAYPLAPVSYDDRPVVDLPSTVSATFFRQNGGSSQIAFVSFKVTISRLNPNSPNYWATIPPPSGNALSILGYPSNFILLEDLDFSYGTGGVELNVPGGGLIPTSNNYIRRSVFYNDAMPIIAFVVANSNNTTLIEDNLFYKDYTSRFAGASNVTITSASPAVITYSAAQTTPPESGGLPPFGAFGQQPPLVALSGPVPTGLSTTTAACDTGGCYYLCNISGATANLSQSSGCGAGTLKNTTGSACNAGCSAKWGDAGANIFSHNIYLDVGWSNSRPTSDGNTVFRNNITAYASATGSQLRSGGIAYNNLYLKNPVQLNGLAWPSEYSYNVMLQPIDMQKSISATVQGWGMTIANYYCTPPASGACTADVIAGGSYTSGSAGTRIHHNILAQTEATPGNGIALGLSGATVFVDNLVQNVAATTGITVESNIICNWATSVNIPYRDGGTGNTMTSSNQPNPVTTNVDKTCAQLGIAAPATVGNYYESIGGTLGSTSDDFLNAAMTKWTKISWDERYSAARVNDYIRQSYGMTNPSNQRRVRLNAIP